MIKEIAQYIENNTSLIIGTDFFVGTRLLPQEANTGVVITEPGSGILDPLFPDLGEYVFQFIAFGLDFYDTRENINEIYTLTHGMEGITLPQIDSGTIWYIEFASALQNIAYLGTDDRGRHEYSFNLWTYRNKIE